MTAAEMQLASIPRRTIARLVDLAIEFVPAIVAVVAIPSTAIGFPVFMVLVFAGAAQDVFGTTRWGQSLGKALLGIRVIDEHSRRPPDLWHAFLRWWIPGLLPPLLVWATWDDRRQGIHDKAAETLVVRAGSKPLPVESVETHGPFAEGSPTAAETRRSRVPR